MKELAQTLGVEKHSVQLWFQNKRARARKARKKLQLTQKPIVSLEILNAECLPPVQAPEILELPDMNLETIRRVNLTDDELNDICGLGTSHEYHTLENVVAHEIGNETDLRPISITSEASEPLKPDDDAEGLLDFYTENFKFL